MPERNPDMVELLKVPEVMRALGLSRSRTYELLGTEIRTVKIGRSVRVPASELAAYVDRRLAEGDAERAIRQA
jgi:excisionase family DNA binding protein